MLKYSSRIEEPESSFCTALQAERNQPDTMEPIAVPCIATSHTRSRHPLCQWPLTTGNGCPGIQDNADCFVLIETTTTSWFMAKRQCATEFPGSLLSYQHPISDNVKNYLRSKANHMMFWIGFHRRAWHWVKGNDKLEDTVLTYDAFLNGEGGSMNEEFCAFIELKQRSAWGDKRCYEQSDYFVCQKERSTKSTAIVTNPPSGAAAEITMTRTYISTEPSTASVATGSNEGNNAFGPVGSIALTVCVSLVIIGSLLGVIMCLKRKLDKREKATALSDGTDNRPPGLHQEHIPVSSDYENVSASGPIAYLSDREGPIDARFAAGPSAANSGGEYVHTYINSDVNISAPVGDYQSLGERLPQAPNVYQTVNGRY